MKMIIRKANNSDLQNITEIIKEFYSSMNDKFNLQKFDSDLQDIQKSYFDKYGYFWLAQINKKIIGTFAFLPIDKEIAEFRRIYVRKDYERQGVGTALMQNAIEHTKKQGMKKIILWSDVRYTKAHNFFKKSGFIEQGKKIFYNADVPWTAIKFEKKL